MVVASPWHKRGYMGLSWLDGAPLGEQPGLYPASWGHTGLSCTGTWSRHGNGGPMWTSVSALGTPFLLSREVWGRLAHPRGCLNVLEQRLDWSVGRTLGAERERFKLAYVHSQRTAPSEERTEGVSGSAKVTPGKPGMLLLGNWVEPSVTFGRAARDTQGKNCRRKQLGAWEAEAGAGVRLRKAFLTRFKGTSHPALGSSWASRRRHSLES